jgi:hypothetical protein
LASLLDENFGLIKSNAAFEVDDDHFGREADNEQKFSNYDHETQMKYLLFYNLKASKLQ